MHDKPTDLYRHFDADNRLLYVGISLDAFSRLRAHKITSGWASEAVHMKTVRYTNRAEAKKAETLAIQTEGPLWNIAETPINAIEQAQEAYRLQTELQAYSEGRAETDTGI